MRTWHPNRTLAGLSLAVILVLTGCAGSVSGGTSQPNTSSKSTSALTVAVERTGGLAGVHQRLVVSPSGHWTYTEREDADEGTLVPKQSRALQRLARRVGGDDASSPKASTGPVCPDTFHYSLTVEHATVTWGQCHGPPSDAARDMVRLLVKQTPL